MHSSTGLNLLKFPIKKQESRSELRSKERSKKAAAEKRDEAVYSAKMAERSQRYRDMLDKMKVVAKMEVELTAEERGLLSRALNQLLSVKLSSWRNLSAMEREELTRGNDINVERVKKYIKSVEKDMNSICDKAQSLVDNHLEPYCSSHDYVYYLKMLGDCFMSYCYEFKTGADKQAYVNRLLSIYEKAARIAEKKLSGVNHIRLGVALSLSTFWNEIADSPQRAIAIAWEAFDAAVIDFERNMNPDSLRIMATLRENIDKWSRDSHTGTSSGRGGDRGEMSEQNAAKRLKR